MYSEGSHEIQDVVPKNVLGWDGVCHEIHRVGWMK